MKNVSIKKNLVNMLKRDDAGQYAQVVAYNRKTLQLILELDDGVSVNISNHQVGDDSEGRKLAEGGKLYFDDEGSSVVFIVNTKKKAVASNGQGARATYSDR